MWGKSQLRDKALWSLGEASVEDRLSLVQALFVMLYILSRISLPSFEHSACFSLGTTAQLQRKCNMAAWAMDLVSGYSLATFHSCGMGTDLLMSAPGSYPC